MSERWRIPSWRTAHWKPEEVTPDLLEAWRAETAECDTHNNAAAKAAADEWRAALNAVEALYGGRKDTAPYKSLKRAGPPVPPHFSFYDVERRVQEAQRKAELEKRSAEAEKEVAELRERAVIWLQARGKVLGQDFRLDSALATANEIAADEEIARLKAEGGPVSFCGDDNCEDCGGWDGESRRCECGNRRVDWVVSDYHTFEEPSIYAEAW